MKWLKPDKHIMATFMGKLIFTNFGQFNNLRIYSPFYERLSSDKRWDD